MSNLSLPSQLTNSRTAHRIQTMAPRHRQEFRQVRPMLRLIVLAPLLSGWMMSLYLAHIHIVSRTFTVSNLPGGFMTGLIWSFITCVTRTSDALLNGPTSHGRNTRHTFFEPKVLCLCPQMSIMQCSMRNQYSGLFTCIIDYLYVLCMTLMVWICVLCVTLMLFIYVYYGLFACINLVDAISLFSTVFSFHDRFSRKFGRFFTLSVRKLASQFLIKVDELSANAADNSVN
jgi:hypothetical protein